MKISKEYIDGTNRVEKVLSTGDVVIWGSIVKDNDIRRNTDLTARTMEIWGVMHLADELKKVVDE